MSDVVKMFDAMSTDYDDLKDLFYSWFFSRMHYFIAKHIIKRNDLEKVLDIGCGTGFQSFLHAAAGSTVEAFDISPELIAAANEKKKRFDYSNLELFPVYFDFVEKYNRLIKTFVNSRRGAKKYISPTFKVANAEQIPYKNEEFDHINCCGSVLNFIPNYRNTIAEISRCLKKKGSFFIEIESRWKLDALWACIDPLLKGKLEVNKNLKEGLRVLIEKPTREIAVPFRTIKKGVPINLNLNLFTVRSFKRELALRGLKVEKVKTIHSITNLIPYGISTTLKPSKRLIKLFALLSRMEELTPINFPGYNTVFIGRKQ